MGLASSVHVECALPDGSPCGWFTTQDLPQSIDDFRLSPDGMLTRAVYDVIEAPDEQPGADLVSTGAFLIRMMREQVGQEPVAFSGFLCLRDGDRHFTARLDEGRSEGIRLGGLESWAGHGGDPWDALSDLALAFSSGRNRDPREVSAYLRSVLASRPRT